MQADGGIVASELTGHILTKAPVKGQGGIG